MKNKYLSLVLSLLLVTVLVSGCSLFEKKEIIPDATQDEKTLDKRTGTIQLQLDAQTKAITYILNTESGETIKLLSVGVNLDRYVGRKIEVSGIYEMRDQTLEVQDVTTLSEELGVKKEYLNGMMGVSFAYPANWMLDESAITGEGIVYIYPYNVPVLERNTIDKVTIMRMPNPNRTSAREWLALDEFFRPSPTSGSAFTYQESVIGKKQYPAVKTVSAGPYQIDFWVQRDTYMYQVVFDSRQPAEKTMNENAFYELVSSFDFIPFTDSAIGVMTSASASTPVGLLPLNGNTEIVSPTASSAVNSAQNTGKYADNTFLTEYEKALSIANGGLQKLDSRVTNDGDWIITKYEFTVPDVNAGPAGVYVTVASTKAENGFRVYATYKNPEDPSSFQYQANFSLNSNGAWILSAGADTGKGVAKVTVNADNSVSIVQPGMQLIDSKRFKAQFQIPAKWYWSITPDGYAFDSKPLQAGVDGMLVLSNEVAAPTGQAATTQSGKKAVFGSAVGKSVVCMSTEKNTFCLLYTDTSLDQAMMLAILDSIVEK